MGAWIGASLAAARNSFDSAAVTGLVPQGWCSWWTST
jgi:hypothetical protein